MEEKKRIQFIDLAKGFCILLVVLIHVFGGLSNQWLLMCGYFRMPLYFFLSGLFFKKYDGFLSFLIKKGQKLLIPFSLFFCLVSIPSIFLTYYIEHHDFQGITSTFIDEYGALNLGINGSIWFLFCLFEVNILFYIMIIICKNNAKLLITLTFIFGIIGYLLNVYNIFVCLWLDTAFTALPFFGIGWILNKKKILLYGSFSKNDFLLLISCFTLLLLIKYYHSENYVISYQTNVYKESIIFLYLGGLVGTLFVVLISKAIKKLPLVSYVGRYSIVLLTTNLIYIFIIRNILYKCGIDQNLTIVNSLVFITVIILSFPTIHYGIRYLPLFFAQDKKTREY